MGTWTSFLEKVGLTKASPIEVTRVMSDVYERTMGVSAPSDVAAYLEYYGNVGWVYICANKIAKRGSTADLKLYKPGKDTLKEEIEEHIFLDVLHKPNNMMSEYQLRFFAHLHLELAGEAFWYIVPNAVGGPGQILPLIPSLMKVVPGESELIKGYIYDVEGQVVAFTPEEIIHFFYPNPDPEEFFRGASPIKALKYALATYTNSEIWNYQFFKNGALPAGYLATDVELDEKEINKLRRMWEKQHRGQKNWQKVAVAASGLKYLDVGLGHKEMDFVLQLEHARDVILAAYGVPKSIAGLVEDVNKANGFQDEMNFATYTIGPALKIMEDTLNAFVLPQYDEKLSCAFINIIPRDEQLTLNKHKLYLASGTLTINEVRAELGLAPVEWGDAPIMPVNMVTFGQSMLPEEPLPGEEVPTEDVPEALPTEDPNQNDTPDAEATPPETEPAKNLIRRIPPKVEDPDEFLKALCLASKESLT